MAHQSRITMRDVGKVKGYLLKGPVQANGQTKNERRR